MKRPLFYYCLCFVLTVAAWYYLGFIAALPLAVILAAGAVLFSKNLRCAALSVAVSCAAMAIAYAHMQWSVLPKAALAGQVGDVILTVTGAQHYGRLTVGEGVADIIAGGRSFENVSVRFTWYGGGVDMVGRSIRARAGIGAIGTGSDTYSRHLPNGRYITLNLPANAEISDSPAHPLTARLALARFNLADAVSYTVGGSAGALLGSILTGESARLSESAREILSISGLSHLTAVSGLHVTLAAGAVVFVFGAGKRRLAYVAAAVVAVGYAALAGFAASSVRAAVMFCIFAAAQLAGRSPDGLTSLGLAGAVMCAVNPFVVGSVSFVLSFLATMGILVLSRPTEDAMMEFVTNKYGKAGWLKAPIASLAVTIGVMVFTAPVSVLVFGRLPLLGFLANMLAVPVMPFALALAAAVALCSIVSPPLAAFAALPARAVAGCILGVARFVSSLPFSSVVITERYQVVLLFGIAAAAIGLAFLKPGGHVLAAAACCAVLASGVTFLGHFAIYGQAYDLLVFDETNTVAIARGGEAVVINLPGDTYGADLVADALERLGVGSAALIMGPSSQSARVFTERIPAAFCFMEDAGRPIGAGAAIPPEGGELTAIGLGIIILPSGEALVGGEKLDAIAHEYVILNKRPVWLMSPVGSHRISVSF